MTGNLQILDWVVVGLVLASIAGLGLAFRRRASTGLDAFFLSNRSLPWYVAGTSMIATAFAADTPLWVTNLVRKFGVHYAWQFWAPFVGAVLAAVYFARLWRRMGFVTDVQFLETRYKGRGAKVLRAWSGGLGALLFCPLIVSWVMKAMETIGREALALPEEYRIWTTLGVTLIAVVLCTSSGLFGVVYTDFLQFGIATFGTVALAVYAVDAVGGLDALVTQLGQRTDWPGHELRVLPSIGDGFGQMSPWNAVGLFGLLWIGVGTSGGHQAQRLLASRNTLHASQAQIFHATVYYALMAWPWILVALCSIVLIPDLSAPDQATAYPRLLVTLLPVGLRGLLVAALLAAFISTMTTLFNWGASYLVNDLWKRFVQPGASDRSYVVIARLATVFIAVVGAVISFHAEDIQQLLTIAYVVGSGTAILTVLRWLWPRLTVQGDLAGVLGGWVLASLLLFGKVFDGPARRFLDLPEGVAFSTDPSLLGARMLLMAVSITSLVVVVSLLTPPTDDETLRAFVRRARPFALFWGPFMRRLGESYEDHESIGRTLLSWLLGVASIGSLLVGIGELLLGSTPLGLGLLAVAAFGLRLTLRRMRADFERQSAAPADASAPTP